ncbi:PepB Leucyl aminopeptidase [uncultured Caudovirales phage]|uniref:PepB Leucyl aminopeptidase n=1 Tax=uncultured Caudovirales phage TaxID=2100421 RepID=A0A6J7XDF5_9CAUD|nr:PepB Leucyl aminopeptidase [uncultured Caudovirales phage]CAB5228150.1 PepB Leucyl aminopeptidase [uncultured Caudovirales phage]
MNNKQVRKLVAKLVDLPPNIATPSYFREHIDKLASRYKNTVNVLNIDTEHPLIRAVDKSESAPSVIVITNNPHSSDIDIALVGKGVTFDTGGHDLKTSKMWEMKSDKAGAMAVLGTLEYILSNNIKVNVVAVLPFVQNLIGPEATLPGSVIKSLSGKNVEIRDTDAEGRLILADSLTTALTFDPREIITIATLTGACAFALGDKFIGVFQNKEEASINSFNEIDIGKDRLIRVSALPGKTLIDKQKGNLLNYIGKELSGSYAAAFLQRFVPDDVPYTHFDIAGPAFIDAKATGAGIDVLIHHVLHHSKGR